MRVLLTRRPAQAGDLEAGLRAAVGPDGRPFEVGFLPATDTELPDDVGMARLRAAAGALEAGEYGVLVVTSPNAARALEAAGWGGGVGEASERGAARVAATGPGTVRVLREAGLRGEAWVPEQDRSAAGILAGLPAPSRAEERLLLPQSARAGGMLADGLRGRGWDVDRVVAYRTVAYPADPARRLLPEDPAGEDVWAPEDLARAVRDEGDRDVSAGPRTSEAPTVVFTSPSAVEELSATAARPVLRTGRVRCVALGQPTLRALERARIPAAAVAATPDAAGVAEALRSV